MKCFVISIGTGEYSGRSERPWRVYTEHADAAAMMAELEAISNGTRDKWAGREDGTEREETISLYKILGVEVDPENWHCDWELNEAELIQK